ncbi:MAG: serine hydrolase [Candidatus Omnitrophota bacterium]
MKILKKIQIILIALCVLTAGCRHEPVDIDINAKCAIIREEKSGKTLFEKNAEERFPPASTAKIMTAVIAVEELSLYDDIIPSSDVTKIEPTVAGLKPGVKYKLKDVLSALLVKSANDAAQVIAERISGKEGIFAGLMNAKAKEIGMKNTFFATASGLPTGKKDLQHTTAYDLSVLMKYAAQYEILLGMMSAREKDIAGSDGDNIYLKTHNRALFQAADAPWGKTGYTKEAKRTFAGTDPSFEPKIVISVLQSEDLWNDILTLKRRGLELYEERRRPFLSKLISSVFARTPDLIRGTKQSQ